MEDSGVFIFMGALTGAFGLRYIYSAITSSYYGTMSSLSMPTSKRITILWLGVVMWVAPYLAGLYYVGGNALHETALEFWNIAIVQKLMAGMMWASAPVAVIAVFSSVWIALTNEDKNIERRRRQVRQQLEYIGR